MTTAALVFGLGVLVVLLAWALLYLDNDNRRR